MKTNSIAIASVIALLLVAILVYTFRNEPIDSKIAIPHQESTDSSIVPLASSEPTPQDGNRQNGPKPEEERIPLTSSVQGHADSQSGANEAVVVDIERTPIGGVDVFWLELAEEDATQRLLELSPENWEASFQQLRTRSDGRFELPVDDLDSPVLLILRKSTYSWHVELLDEIKHSFELKPSAKFRGWVVDLDGIAIPGATVQRSTLVRADVDARSSPVQIAESKFLRETHSTSKDGSFSLLQSSTAPAVLKISADGYATSIYTDFTPPIERAFVLSQGSIVHGLVVDDDNRPVEDAWVKTIANGSLPEAASPWAFTGEDGSYAIESSHSGSISVVAWTQGRYPVSRIWANVKPRESTEVNISLRPPTSISGLVKDMHGDPISGATIGAESTTTGIYIGQAQSSSNGSFEISGTSSGELYRLVSLERNYSPVVLPNIPAGSSDCIITLLPIPIIKIQIGGSLKAKLIRTRLFLKSSLLPASKIPESPIRQTFFGYPALEAEVEEDGSFTISYWAGVYDAEFSAPGLQTVVMKNLRLEPDAEPVTIEFAEATPHRGRVIDGDTGLPISGAAILHLSRYPNGNLIAVSDGVRCTSDSDGSFDMGHFPKGNVSLRVMAEGYAWKTLTGVSRSSSGQPLEITLDRGGTIQGRVETDYSNPSSTLEVTIRSVGEENGASQYVDHKGEFRFENVPLGLVEVSLRDHYYESAFPDSEAAIRQVRVSEGEVAQLKFDAATGVPLEGTLLNWDKPVMIEARKIDSLGDIAGAAMTDPDGNFHIPHLLPGKYLVGAATGEPGFSVSLTEEVEIGTSPPAPLTLSVPQTRMSGTIVGSQNNPIAKALVSIYEKPNDPRPQALCLTDDSGQFEIGGLKASLYDLIVSGADLATEVQTGVPAPGEVPPILLLPEARLVVRVIDDLSRPLPGAWVDVIDSRHSRLTQRALTSKQGETLFTSLAARTYTLSVSKRGYVPVTSSQVTTRSSDVITHEIQLVRVGAIKITVRTQERRPISGAEVLLYDAEGTLVKEEPELTSVQGAAKFGDLKPGDYIIVLDDAEEEVTVLPGETTEVETELFR